MENLCPSYQSIFEDLKELKRLGHISHCWTFNGTVRYKKTINEEEKPIKVLHESDLNEFFYDEGDP